MATKEEIKEYYSAERWSMFQGAVIFFIVVGFVTNYPIPIMVGFLVSSCLLSLAGVKIIHHFVNKKKNFSANWLFRLVPTIFHLSVVEYII